jgi:hypothetical protein
VWQVFKLLVWFTYYQLDADSQVLFALFASSTLSAFVPHEYHPIPDTFPSIDKLHNKNLTFKVYQLAGAGGVLASIVAGCPAVTTIDTATGAGSAATVNTTVWAGKATPFASEAFTVNVAVPTTPLATINTEFGSTAGLSALVTAYTTLWSSTVIANAVILATFGGFEASFPTADITIN